MLLCCVTLILLAHILPIGELPNGVPQNLLPYVTQTAMGIREKLSVFGDDYDTPDGSCIRDYIYVVDLAKAHVIAMDRILNNKQKEKVEVFNIGTGKGVSVLELINTFEKATGVKLNYQIVGRRAGDIEKVWANPDFANRGVGMEGRSQFGGHSTFGLELAAETKRKRNSIRIKIFFRKTDEQRTLVWRFIDANNLKPLLDM